MTKVLRKSAIEELHVIKDADDKSITSIMLMEKFKILPPRSVTPILFPFSIELKVAAGEMRQEKDRKQIQTEI